MGVNAQRTRRVLAPHGCLVTSKAGLLSLDSNGTQGVETSAAHTVAGAGAATAQCKEVAANVSTRRACPGPVGVRKGVYGTQRALRRARDSCIGSGWASDVGKGLKNESYHLALCGTVRPINQCTRIARTYDVCPLLPSGQKNPSVQAPVQSLNSAPDPLPYRPLGHRQHTPCPLAEYLPATHL